MFVFDPELHYRVYNPSPEDAVEIIKYAESIGLYYKTFSNGAGKIYGYNIQNEEFAVVLQL